MKILETLTHLEKNLLFQMSLGSKELFHSNLLAWLMKTDIGIAKEIFKSWGILNSKELKDIKVEREKHNIDLLITITFYDDSKKLVVIENKLKSIPYPNQLDKYSEVVNRNYQEISDKKFILLSLTKPTFLLSNGWEFKSYSHLFDALEHIEIEIRNEENVSFFQLNDILLAYKDFVKSLNDIYSGITDNVRYDFYNSNNELIKKLREIRIHDLVLKTVHQQISDEVIYRISKELNIKNKRYREDLNEVLDFSVGVGFTNSTGISDLKILIHKGDNFKYLLGIQLQANQLRFVSEVTQADETIRQNHISLALELEEKKMWLLEGDSVINCLEIDNARKGSGRGRNKSHSFCEFGKGGFLYRYDYLANENQIKSIIEAFVIATKYIIERVDDFRSLAQKHLDK